MKKSANSSEDYDAYYASLQPSAAHTPPAWPSLNVEIEEKKPDINYLNGRAPSYPPLTPASLPGTPYNADWGQSRVNVNGKRQREDPGQFTFNGEGGEMTLAEEVGFVSKSGNDPTVYGKAVYYMLIIVILTKCSVSGKPMKFSEITEEHHEMMTTEEYTAYFEAYQTHGGQ